MDWCEAIYPAYARLTDDPVTVAEASVNARVGSNDGRFAPPLPAEGHVPSQQHLCLSLSAATAKSLREHAAPFARCCQSAYSAPMSGRWLAAPPSKTIDMHLSNAEISMAARLHLGVEVLEGNHVCRFCGEVLDVHGVHAISCMSGGDVLLRHNRVRNAIFRYACRGRLNAELEKSGILDEEGVFVDLSRPADIMVEDLGAAHGMERVALDIKVINALGAGHFADTLQGPLVAAEKYREAALSRANVRARCAERGVRYEPIVFTAQGGCEKHAEAILSQIADSVANAECRGKGKVKAELLQTLSLSIAQSVAKAVLRRVPRPRYLHSDSNIGTFLAEIATLKEPPDD